MGSGGFLEAPAEKAVSELEFPHELILRTGVGEVGEVGEHAGRVAGGKDEYAFEI